MLLSDLLRAVTALASAGLLWAGCLAEPVPPPDHAALRAGWDAWRAERDSLFASDASPVPAAKRAAFPGLRYFAYDSTLAVTAALVPPTAPDTVRFPTTTGELRPMVAAGHLAFELGGAPRRLAAYQPVGPLAELRPRLFVPFRDATAGAETYGGGRYLDLDLDPDGRYALDLNRAYHPYCVYDPAFSCPLPPPENTLTLPVRAGERL